MMTRVNLQATCFNIFAQEYILVSIVSTLFVFFIISVITFWGGHPGVGIFCLLGIGIIGGFLSLAFKTYRKVATQEAEDLIFTSIKKGGLKSFDLNQTLSETNTKKAPVHRACSNIYERFVRKALKDFTITEEERKALKYLQNKLGLSEETAVKIEELCKKDTYRKELSGRMGDGILSSTDENEMADIRGLLGLSNEEALNATKDDVIDAYRVLFRRLANGGNLNAVDFERLKGFARATGLTASEAARISMKDALNLYRSVAAMICQDGFITDEELGKLNTLVEILELPESQIKEIKERINVVRELGQIRKGKLPSLRANDLPLKNTEICRWRGPCTYSYKTPTQTKQLNGELVVVDGRVIFTSPNRSLEFKIRRIVNVRTYSNAVNLTLSTTKGQGTYFTKDSEKLAAILEALVRRQNFMALGEMDTEKQRHIPQDVKVAVWQRDGGVCVRCRANDYLEYDHIIPFSRGGSNSENNVQLLCRRCNLEKSDNL